MYGLPAISWESTTTAITNALAESFGLAFWRFEWTRTARCRQVTRLDGHVPGNDVLDCDSHMDVT